MPHNRKRGYTVEYTVRITASTHDYVEETDFDDAIFEALEAINHDGIEIECLSLSVFREAAHEWQVDAMFRTDAAWEDFADNSEWNELSLGCLSDEVAA
jgi:hypothetical protein